MTQDQAFRDFLSEDGSFAIDMIDAVLSQRKMEAILRKQQEELSYDRYTAGVPEVEVRRLIGTSQSTTECRHCYASFNSYFQREDSHGGFLLAKDSTIYLRCRNCRTRHGIDEDRSLPFLYNP